MQETFLICLPFAGAGASFFKSWQSQAPEGLRVVPVQLPGREERLAEPAYTEAARAVEEAFSRVTEQVDGACRVTLFGHSLGAVLAYELAHRLIEAQGFRDLHLFVSGSPSPYRGRTDFASGLDDDEFLARVRSFAGYSHPALEDPEMRELLLPILRADVEMHESYRPSSSKPLSIPITSLRGTDDELVSATEAAQWAEATTGAFATVELAGGHMYLADHADALLELITAGLGTVRGR
ncbi:thioesterase II family protein [Streptomyces sp. NPDC090306]|uniref:thioesterase II family protein n=1 Tax=Streptomyces sp. NPDC090306 TaxID=3365961 RepID=UPI0038193A91